MTSGDEHPKEVEGVGCYKAADPNIFWHQGPVLWKMIFPQTGFEGQFGHDSSALHLLCTLFLLLLPQLHLRSSGIRLERLGPGDQGTVVRQTPHHTRWEVTLT